MAGGYVATAASVRVWDQSTQHQLQLLFKVPDIIAGTSTDI